MAKQDRVAKTAKPRKNTNAVYGLLYPREISIRNDNIINKSDAEWQFAKRHLALLAVLLACLLFGTGHAQAPNYYNLYYFKRTNDTEKNTYYREVPEGTFIRIDQKANSIKLYELFEDGTKEITITETEYYDDSDKDSSSSYKLELLKKPPPEQKGKTSL